MKRFRPGPELMDDPAIPRAELDEALGFIRIVNRRLGGAAALLGHLKKWSRNWPKAGQGTVTLLDIATGSADIPIAAVRWASGAGFDLRVTAVDIHETTLELAREHLTKHPEEASSITIEKADALRLMDRFSAQSFDYVHAGMFLHHLPDLEVLTALRIMDRLARVGIVWNDLIRSHIALAGIRVLTLASPPYVKRDAIASVKAGFSAAEVKDMARRLELGYAKYQQNFFAQRFTLAGERPGAWKSYEPRTK